MPVAQDMFDLRFEVFLGDVNGHGD